MSKTKKIIIALIVFCLTTVLAACQSNTSSEITTTSDSDASTIEKSTENDSDNDDFLPAFDKTVTIEETTLYDQNNIKITATELIYNSYSVELSLRIENLSDKNYTVHAGTISCSENAVNGYMLSDGYLNCEVAAENTEEDTMSFSYSEMTILGINKIAQIQVGFEISDDDSDSFRSGPVLINTSAAASYDIDEDTYLKAVQNKSVQTAVGYSLDYFSDEKIYSESNVEILSEALIVNKDSDQSLILEFVNHNPGSLRIRLYGLGVNGLTVYSSAVESETISADKKCLLGINLDNYLKEYKDAFDIDDLSSVSFSIEMFNSDNMKVAETENITVKLSDNASSFGNDGKEVFSTGNIRLVYIGAKDDSNNSEMVSFSSTHLLFLAENNSSEAIKIQLGESEELFQQVTVNDKAYIFMLSAKEVSAGESAVLDLELSSFENESGIISADAIKSIKLDVAIKDTKSNIISQSTITIEQ